MHDFHFGEWRRTLSGGAIGLLCAAALIWVGSGGAELMYGASTARELPALGNGLLGGIFVAGAACAVVATWRRHAGRATGWIGATGALLAVQALLVTLLAMRSQPRGAPITLVLLLLVAVAGLIAVVGPLLALRRSSVLDDGFVIGLGMGLVASGHLLLQLPVSPSSTPLAVVVLGVVLATHLTATALVVRHRTQDRRISWLLLLTALVVDAALVVHVGGLAGTAWDTAGSTSRAAAAATWLTIAWVSLRGSLEEDRRRMRTFEQVLVASTRDQRERMHELRSTLAGLVTGSAMLDNPAVPAEVRQRMWRAVRRELDRMERLVSAHDETATDIDLDEAMSLILDLQRLKGRRVEFHSNGDVVHARFDALSEVVNILMDNATTHGGTDRSLIEVVRSSEEMVDIKVTDFGRGIPAEERTHIFDWGRRGLDSPGEGIGLNLAQRLMTEDGGTLRLAEDRGVGSSFVISLPAARRSPENDLTAEVGHGWRLSG